MDSSATLKALVKRLNWILSGYSSVWHQEELLPSNKTGVCFCFPGCSEGKNKNAVYVRTVEGEGTVSQQDAKATISYGFSSVLGAKWEQMLRLLTEERRSYSRPEPRNRRPELRRPRWTDGQDVSLFHRHSLQQVYEDSLALGSVFSSEYTISDQGEPKAAADPRDSRV